MDYTLGDVLRDVNNIRFYEFSLPPLEKLPKGIRRGPSGCVIARCFPCYEHGFEPFTDGDKLFYYDDESIEIPLPEVIRLFVLDFDTGEWPSLIEKNVSSVDSATDVNSQTLSIVAS